MPQIKHISRHCFRGSRKGLLNTSDTGKNVTQMTQRRVLQARSTCCLKSRSLRLWNTMTKSHLGKKDTLALHILNHSSMRKAQAGTQTGQAPGGGAAAEPMEACCSLLAPHGLLSVLSYRIQAASPGMAPVTTFSFFLNCFFKFTF